MAFNFQYGTGQLGRDAYTAGIANRQWEQQQLQMKYAHDFQIRRDAANRRTQELNRANALDAQRNDRLDVREVFRQNRLDQRGAAQTEMITDRVLRMQAQDNENRSKQARLTLEAKEAQWKKQGLMDRTLELTEKGEADLVIINQKRKQLKENSSLPEFAFRQEMAKYDVQEGRLEVQPREPEVRFNPETGRNETRDKDNQWVVTDADKDLQKEYESEYDRWLRLTSARDAYEATLRDTMKPKPPKKATDLTEPPDVRLYTDAQVKAMVDARYGEETTRPPNPFEERRRDQGPPAEDQAAVQPVDQGVGPQPGPEQVAGQPPVDEQGRPMSFEGDQPQVGEWAGVGPLQGGPEQAAHEAALAAGDEGEIMIASLADNPDLIIDQRFQVFLQNNPGARKDPRIREAANRATLTGLDDTTATRIMVLADPTILDDPTELERVRPHLWPTKAIREGDPKALDRAQKIQSVRAKFRAKFFPEGVDRSKETLKEKAKRIDAYANALEAELNKKNSLTDDEMKVLRREVEQSRADAKKARRDGVDEEYYATDAFGQGKRTQIEREGNVRKKLEPQFDENERKARVAQGKFPRSRGLTQYKLGKTGLDPVRRKSIRKSHQSANETRFEKKLGRKMEHGEYETLKTMTSNQRKYYLMQAQNGKLTKEEISRIKGTKGSELLEALDLHDDGRFDREDKVVENIHGYDVIEPGTDTHNLYFDGKNKETAVSFDGGTGQIYLNPSYEMDDDVRARMIDHAAVQLAKSGVGGDTAISFHPTPEQIAKVKDMNLDAFNYEWDAHDSEIVRQIITGEIEPANEAQRKAVEKIKARLDADKKKRQAEPLSEPVAAGQHEEPPVVPKGREAGTRRAGASQKFYNGKPVGGQEPKPSETAIESTPETTKPVQKSHYEKIRVSTGVLKNYEMDALESYALENGGLFTKEDDKFYRANPEFARETIKSYNVMAAMPEYDGPAVDDMTIEEVDAKLEELLPAFRDEGIKFMDKELEGGGEQAKRELLSTITEGAGKQYQSRKNRAKQLASPSSQRMNVTMVKGTDDFLNDEEKKGNYESSIQNPIVDIMLFKAAKKTPDEFFKKFGVETPAEVTEEQKAEWARESGQPWDIPVLTDEQEKNYDGTYFYVLESDPEALIRPLKGQSKSKAKPKKKTGFDAITSRTRPIVRPQRGKK